MLGLILLFIVLTPGVLFTIPKGKNKILTACVHAVIFVFLMRVLHVEGFQDGAGTGKEIDTYFMMTKDGIKNIYTTDPRITLTGAGTGMVNIISSDQSVKINGIHIYGMKTPSATWPAEVALMKANGYNGTKLVLSKGSVSSTGPKGFMFGSDGIPVKGATLNIKGMWGTAVWGEKNPDGVGAPPPSNAKGGSGNVNTRIRFMLA